MFFKDEPKYKSYYFLSPTLNLDGLEKNIKVMANRLCHNERSKYINNNPNRNVISKNLDLNSDELKELTSDSVLHVCGHGNHTCIGLSENGILFSPEKFADELALKLNKEKNICIKFNSCNSGISSEVAGIVSKKFKTKHFGDKETKSFAERFAIQMQKNGYFNLTVYGYIGKVITGKKPKEIKKHSYVFLGESAEKEVRNSDDIPKELLKARHSKIGFKTSESGIEPLLENKKAIEYATTKPSRAR